MTGITRTRIMYHGQALPSMTTAQAQAGPRGRDDHIKMMRTFELQYPGACSDLNLLPSLLSSHELMLTPNKDRRGMWYITGRSLAIGSQLHSIPQASSPVSCLSAKKRMHLPSYAVLFLSLLGVLVSAAPVCCLPPSFSGVC